MHGWKVMLVEESPFIVLDRTKFIMDEKNDYFCSVLLQVVSNSHQNL